MQLSTLNLEKWNENAPFVDSLCLPIYSISATNQEHSLRKIREIEAIAFQLEKKMMGRLLLLPAVYDSKQESSVFQEYLAQILKSFLQMGFHFAITISDHKVPSIHLEEMEHVRFQIAQELLTEEQVEASVDQCYQQILDLWVKNTEMEKTKK